MSAKIERIIARQKARINEGNYYESHQQIRVIATRYVKAGEWRLAIDILFEGALALLRSGQGSSGGDLSLYLVEVLVKAGIKPSAVYKDEVLTLLRSFPTTEPTRKKFLSNAITWTSKLGDFDNGDPELHHVAGLLFCEGVEPYDAERHFILGTRDSPEALARMEFNWYIQDDFHTAPLYAARCVLPYLLVRNLRYANKAYIIFTSRLSSERAVLGVQDVSSSTADFRLFPSLPLLNFLGLLLLAVQRRSADQFRYLKAHYTSSLRDVDTWSGALEQIGEIWFGITIQRPGNPLLDMMGNMLFGGSGGGNTGQAPSTQRVIERTGQRNPPAADLD